MGRSLCTNEYIREAFSKTTLRIAWEECRPFLPWFISIGLAAYFGIETLTRFMPQKF
jgi:hypothetical protein